MVDDQNFFFELGRHLITRTDIEKKIAKCHCHLPPGVDPGGSGDVKSDLAAWPALALTGCGCAAEPARRFRAHTRRTS